MYEIIQAEFNRAGRFVIVGLGSNATLYVGFLVITALGMEHKVAMTLCYIAGVILSFTLNRFWTFQSKGQQGTQFIRFIIVYFIGYIVNLIILILFVDFFEFTHQWIQLCAMFILVLYFFAAQRLWVFRT